MENLTDKIEINDIEALPVPPCDPNIQLNFMIGDSSTWSIYDPARGDSSDYRLRRRYTRSFSDVYNDFTCRSYALVDKGNGVFEWELNTYTPIPCPCFPVYDCDNTLNPDDFPEKPYSYLPNPENKLISETFFWTCINPKTNDWECYAAQWFSPVDSNTIDGYMHYTSFPCPCRQDDVLPPEYCCETLTIDIFSSQLDCNKEYQLFEWVGEYGLKKSWFFELNIFKRNSDKQIDFLTNNNNYDTRKTKQIGGQYIQRNADYQTRMYLSDIVVSDEVFCYWGDDNEKIKVKINTNSIDVATKYNLKQNFTIEVLEWDFETI